MDGSSFHIVFDSTEAEAVLGKFDGFSRVVMEEMTCAQQSAVCFRYTPCTTPVSLRFLLTFLMLGRKSSLLLDTAILAPESQQMIGKVVFLGISDRNLAGAWSAIWNATL